jgi:hypothetical protein
MIIVHKALGIGFQEVIYQRALAIEFGIVGIIFVIGTFLRLVIILPDFFFLRLRSDNHKNHKRNFQFDTERK